MSETGVVFAWLALFWVTIIFGTLCILHSYHIV